MARIQIVPVVTVPTVAQYLPTLTVDQLKWYAPVVTDRIPNRKGELMTLLTRALTNPTQVQQLWERCTPVQQQIVSEVVHTLGGRYNRDRIEAKYPGAAAPTSAHGYYGYYSSFGYGAGRKEATPFDLLFGYSYDLGTFIPADLLATLKTFVPEPPPPQLHSQADPPSVSAKDQRSAPEVMVSTTERTVFHDLAATLSLVGEGKVSVSASTRMPTLTTLRQLRQRLLVGEYFEEQEYERAEDAIRPLALIMLVQAAKWAAPGGTSGKLELTKNGEKLLVAPIEARHIREVWQRWLSTDLLDELSRIRTIKGQQSKAVRLTKPAERRAKLNGVLPLCPVGRWIELDELLRYMRAEGQLPEVERNAETALYIGPYAEYGWADYGGGVKYWDVVIGSYLRALLWEYAATLGLIEIAYTLPEKTPHDFGEMYGMYDYDYISRYDGLLGLRLTNLGAFVLGLTSEYTPPEVEYEQGPALLQVLPNLDVVITDASRVMPNERAFLERIGTLESQDVYRLSRDQVLEATRHNLSVEQILAFLASKSALPEEQLPQTVHVFFQDIRRRLEALRDGGKHVVLESDDPYLLTELANVAALRGSVQLAAIDGRTVLLVAEEREAAARRQLRKLGYVPRKG